MVPSPAKLRRVRRGLTQADVARAIGATQAAVSLVELGRRLAGPTFLGLARCYDLDPAALRRRMVAWRRRLGRPIAPPLAPRMTGKRRAVA